MAVHAFITGGAGFIGSHLAELLLEHGRHVSVVDDESTGSKRNLDGIKDHPNFSYVCGSVSSREVVREQLDSADEVYHLAASVGVQRISDAPIESIERNIAPVEILLAEMHKQLQRGRSLKLFLASTSEVYGKNSKEVWCEEDDIVLGPTTYLRWSYGASKAIDEFLSLAYHRQHGLPVVIGRFFNVVGPRQVGHYGMVLPRFVDRALAGNPPIVHDDGRQIRCFSHVKDACRAVFALMETSEAVGQVVNIGSDQPVEIVQLAQQVLTQVDPELGIEFQPYHEAYSHDFEDVRHRVPDLTRLRSLIDHRPEYDLDEIIAEVIEWKKGWKA